eukprot:1438027-Prorocentrum_lima.AAC.1
MTRNEGCPSTVLSAKWERTGKARKAVERQEAAAPCRLNLSIRLECSSLDMVLATNEMFCAE